MYLLSRDQELNYEYLTRVCMKFQTTEQPQLVHRWQMYKGVHPILAKNPTDVGKICNKVVVNFQKSIVENYLGYMGTLPVRYSSEEDITPILDVLNYNDSHAEDTELLRQALVYGTAYEINYIDLDGKQRFTVLPSDECIPIYWKELDGELAYVVRLYVVDPLDTNTTEYYVDVYGNDAIKHYKAAAGFSSFRLLGEEPNYFNQVPVTVFKLTPDADNIFDCIETLSDAYEKVFSSSVDDWESWADAYLILKNCTANEDDLDSMKKHRVLMLDDNGDASYLTKSVQDTDVQHILELTERHIHQIANSPNLNDEAFAGNQSGQAIRYKLLGFENACGGIEAQMRMALQKRIELICSVLTVVNGEEIWRDMNIIFTRNLPQGLTPSSATELMQYRGLVSDKTLLGLLPFVPNVNEEIEELEAQNLSNMALYDFSTDVNEGEDEQVLAGQGS